MLRSALYSPHCRGRAHILLPKRVLSRSVTSITDLQTESDRIKGLRPNIFAKFSALATEHNAINLGQGFPSFGTPDFVKQAAVEAIMNEHNQYNRPGGHPELVAEIADMYSELYGKKINGLTEVVTFTGAQEGIYSIFKSLLNDNDEIVVLEPYFDAYVTISSTMNIKVKGIPLVLDQKSRSTTSEISSSDLKLDISKLDSMITPNTKMLVLNTPHNPTGKVFSKAELEEIAAVVRKHPQLTVLSDEVYEFMTFDGLPHERFALLPDMYDRTISLFSAGKTFSCTGWRVGYAICASHYAASIIKTHSTIPFCAPTPFEVAVKDSLKAARKSDYFTELPALLQKKRDSLVSALREAGLDPIVPEGGYFVLCDVKNLSLYKELGLQNLKVHDGMDLQEYPDYQIAVNLCKKEGIVAIPTSPFYSEENRHLAGGVVRIAFCKDDKSLNGAISIFKQLGEK